MSLSFGRTILAIPGPSIMPDRVLQAMHAAAPNIYEGDLVEKTDVILDRLKQVADTKHDVAIYIANGHGVWEAAIANTFSPGDKALVLTTGRFAQGWSEVASKMGVECEWLDFGPAGDATPALVEARLADDTKREIKAVIVVQTDTASSVTNDIPGLRAAIDAAAHPALFMVDCIASLACEEFHMDDWGVDVMVAGSQKGLMTPPGIGFVFFGPRAWDAHAEARCNTAYWDWKPRTRGDLFYQKFFGTAPTHHLLGLHEALKMLIEEEGMENVWARHRSLARAVWAAVDTWSGYGGVMCNISDQERRSVAVTTIRCGVNDAQRIRTWCDTQMGVTLGIGLEIEPNGKQVASGLFRIGHMGHLNPHMLLGTLASVQTALTALDIPHDPAGLIAATQVVATEAQRRL